MIISASRRTDIPALYSEWFLNRLEAGEICVPNPYNRKKVSRYLFSPESVDCIVFWTKNPEPMLSRLKEIDRLSYRYYFQMTITGYGQEEEVNLPPTEEAMATFLLLSDRIGRERIDWRYDPVILSSRYTRHFHLERFEMMCEWIHRYTTRCIISFVDAYKGSPYLEPEPEEITELAKCLARIARKYQLPLYTCAEKINLEAVGIRHGACIDKDRISELTGYKLDLKKDTGQRRECACVSSIDIGVYDTCTNGCRYCYATRSSDSAVRKRQEHDPRSPLLIGNLRGDETITDKILTTSRDIQMSLFDLLGNI